MIINKNIWPTWAYQVAYPSQPEEYNEAAVDRLMKRVDGHVVRVKGVRPQFEAENRVEHIYFKTKEERQYYEDTETRYFREKAKLEADIDAGLVSSGGLLHLVLLMKRCMAAEMCRVPHIVERMIIDYKAGLAPVCAAKYKNTINACVEMMITKYGISRDDISLIYGGGQTGLTAKMKAKKNLTEKADKLKELDIDIDEMIDTLDLKDTEVREIKEYPKEWRLGSQGVDERQKEIDRFQAGRTKYCFFSFKAGGVGLSLHHTDEFCKQKVKRKPNGYAVEEDIKNIPTKPRSVIVAPTYSAIELVQGLGRCPRLTSLSPTRQVLLFYADTVEVEVARIVSQKLRCLSRVVRMRESWQDVVIGAKPDQYLKDNEPDEDNGNVLFGDSGEADDE